MSASVTQKPNPSTVGRLQCNGFTRKHGRWFFNGENEYGFNSQIFQAKTFRDRESFVAIVDGEFFEIRKPEISGPFPSEISFLEAKLIIPLCLLYLCRLYTSWVVNISKEDHHTMLMKSLSTFIRSHSANKEATTDDKQLTEAGVLYLCDTVAKPGVIQIDAVVPRDLSEWYREW